MNALEFYTDERLFSISVSVIPYDITPKTFDFDTDLAYGHGKDEVFPVLN
jgi:hypothetical protein